MGVVAIDGPSGVGKSTVARAVAVALGIPHLDTGAYYRAATLLALRAAVDPGDEAGIVAALAAGDIDYEQTGEVMVDGADVGTELRGPEVTAAVSAVSAHAGVRRAIVAMQRAWVERRAGSAVVEGRDIGTVVFPEAAVKVYLTATPEVRAARRAADPEAAGFTLEELVAQMRERDALDSSREVSPLRPAADAVVIDTSELTVADVVGRVLDLVGRP